MFPFNWFCFNFLPIITVIIVLLILKILNLFSIFTFIAFSAQVLWLSWNLMSFLRKYMPKESVPSSGKAVLITGCDSGFGLMIAEALHEMGFTVFACCLSDNSVGAQKLNQMNIRTLEMDVTNEEQIKNSRIYVENYLKETNSKLWAVVNNAGLFTSGLIEWGDGTDLKKVLDVNVIGLVRVSRQFLPLIRKSKGRVINIASCAGRFTVPTFAYYSMSKYAVIAFSDALRREMFLWDVKVITIEPMHYKTPMTNEDRIHSSLLDLWEGTPSEVKLDYGQRYFNSVKENLVSTIAATRTQTDVVVNAVVDAVTNIRPKIRYSCCDFTFGIMWWCFETLPNEIVDKAVYLYTLLLGKPRALDNGF